MDGTYAWGENARQARVGAGGGAAQEDTVRQLGKRDGAGDSIVDGNLRVPTFWDLLPFHLVPDKRKRRRTVRGPWRDHARNARARTSVITEHILSTSCWMPTCWWGRCLRVTWAIVPWRCHVKVLFYLTIIYHLNTSGKSSVVF